MRPWGWGPMGQEHGSGESPLLPRGEAVKLGWGRNSLCKNDRVLSPEWMPFSPITSMSPESPLQVGPGHEEVGKDRAGPPPAPVLTWQVGVMATLRVYSLDI